MRLRPIHYADMITQITILTYLNILEWSGRHASMAGQPRRFSGESVNMEDGSLMYCRRRATRTWRLRKN